VGLGFVGKIWEHESSPLTPTHKLSIICATDARESLCDRPCPGSEFRCLSYGVTYLKGCFRPSVISAYDTWF
jgi:hypothetical protein